MSLKVYDTLGREKQALVGAAPVVVRAERVAGSTGMASGYNGPIFFDSEIADTDGVFTGSRFQPTKPGWYHVSTSITLSSATASLTPECYVLKNHVGVGGPASAAEVIEGGIFSTRSDGWVTMTLSGDVFLNGTTDYIEVWIWTPNATMALRGGLNEKTDFSVHSVAPVGPVAAGSPPPLVSSLPGAGAVPDGFEVYFVADPANGVLWHLRYGAAAKWFVLGGPPLYAEVLTTGSKSTGTFDALASAGPSIALPLPGDYDVTVGAHCNTAGANYGQMSYDIGATAAVAADGPEWSDVTTDYQWAERTRRKTGLTAVTLTAKYAARGNGTTDIWKDRVMRVMPVRIG